jgi:hypothetical protein
VRQQLKVLRHKYWYLQYGRAWFKEVFNFQARPGGNKLEKRIPRAEHPPQWKGLEARNVIPVKLRFYKRRKKKTEDYSFMNGGPDRGSSCNAIREETTDPPHIIDR